jgi:2-keto-3-deoxy-L-rhamnonate aldolase RhmA
LSKISTLAADRYETAAFAKISHAASIRVMCAIAGMDAIILDTEHGAFTEAELEAHCALISALGVMPVIRVARPEANLIARAIDRGARGVMVPQAESVDQVESALRGMELAPVGARGWDPTVSANQYGAYSGAAAQVRCFIQIETAAALAHAGAIASIPTVTDIFVGPADLSRALGSTGEIFSRAVVDACESLAPLASTIGLGLFVDTRARADWALALGYAFLAVGSDVGFLREGGLGRVLRPAPEVNATGY